MIAATTFAVAAVLAVGALVQRSTGIGFALLSGPALVLLLGPNEAVLVANGAGSLVALAVGIRMRRHVEWRVYGILIAFSILGMIPGLALVSIAPAPVLQIVIGGLLLVGVALTLLPGRAQITSRQLPAVAATSGFMSITAALAGPPLGAYATATGWDHQRFVATVQPYFFTASIIAVVSKVLLAGETLSLPSWPELAVLAGGTVLGLVLGDLLAGRIRTRVLQKALLVVAVLGAAATIVLGVTALVRT